MANNRLREVEELEAAERTNIDWQREKDLMLQQSNMCRAMHLMSERTSGAQHKQERQAEHRWKTYERRVISLVCQEQKRRLTLLLGEQMALENILRSVSRDIRTEVFVSAQSTQQRIKYFNKTLDIILKKESQGRMAVHKQERYAFLVLRQKAGNAHSKQTSSRKATKQKKDPAADPADSSTRSDDRALSDSEGHPSGDDSKTGTTATNTEGSRSRGRSDRDSNNAARKTNNGDITDSQQQQQQSTTSAAGASERKSHVGHKHTAEFFEQCLASQTEKEAFKRSMLQDDEEQVWNQRMHHLDYLIMQDEERQLGLRHMAIDTNRVNARHVDVLLQDETTQRRKAEKMHEHGVATIVRKLNRRLLEESQRQDEEAIRHAVHSMRVERKFQHVTAQRAAMTEKYTAAAGSSSSTTLPPISQSQSFPYVDAREGALLKAEEASRARIEKEQDLQQLIIRNQSRKAPQDVEGLRFTTVKQRRLDILHGTVARMSKQQQEQIEKSTQCAMVSKAQVAQAYERRKLATDEHRARVELMADSHARWVDVERSYKGVTRTLMAFDSVFGTESRARKEVAAEEQSRRDSLRNAFGTWKPVARKVIAPLPPPPTDFEEARRVYSEFYKSTAGPTKPRKAAAKKWEPAPVHPRSRRTISSIPLITTAIAKISGPQQEQQQLFQQHLLQRQKKQTPEHQPRPPPKSIGAQRAATSPHVTTATSTQPGGAKTSGTERKKPAPPATDEGSARRSKPDTTSDSPNSTTKAQSKRETSPSSTSSPSAARSSSKPQKGTSSPNSGKKDEKPASGGAGGAAIEDDEYGEMSGSSSRSGTPPSQRSSRASSRASSSGSAKAADPEDQNYSTDEDHR